MSDMPVQGTSVRADLASPDLPSGQWYKPEDRPLRLTIDVPLSAGHAAAALYDDAVLDQNPEDLVADEYVLEAIAIAIVMNGLSALHSRADELAVLEAVDRPAWLARCRRRAAEVMGVPETAQTVADGGHSGMGRSAGLRMDGALPVGRAIT
jgi:hypothetical protein